MRHDRTTQKTISRFLSALDRQWLQAHCGCTASAVNQWTSRGIPARHAYQVVARAKALGVAWEGEWFNLPSEALPAVPEQSAATPAP